ncbi:hypothetical protein K8T06_01215 [bacterium]|nr:hypothetical protein [bacterium]
MDLTKNTWETESTNTYLPEGIDHLRQVEINNVVSMEYLDVKRGNPELAPDQLRLDRMLWLRFDGSGYTIQDRISGTKKQQLAFGNGSFQSYFAWYQDCSGNILPIAGSSTG